MCASSVDALVNSGQRNDSLGALELQQLYLFARKYIGNLGEKINADLLEKTIVVHVTLLTPQIDLVDLEYTIWDKFANFGGNFGIFAEITGIHFLGVMNGIILAIKLLSSKTLSKIKRNCTKPSKTTSKKV